VGRTLIAEGAIDRTQMSMQAIRGWMRAHPDSARAIMESDQSFVFFRLAPLGDPSLGSPGSEGVPLTPGASIAIDEHLHPLGAPFFVAASVPDVDPAKPDHALDRLFVAQDTGGAIKGAARADVFWGFGRDAESIAGRMKSAGHLYVLLPKPLAARISQRSEFSPL
jgi:membrane-bound lytic murein transglycosylase A